MLIDRLRRLFGRGAKGEGDGEPEMLSCREALARLQEYVDGELPGLSHEQVEAHFEVCTRCYPHLTLERTFRERVRTALSRPEVPSDLRARVLEMLAEDAPD